MLRPSLLLTALLIACGPAVPEFHHDAFSTDSAAISLAGRLVVTNNGDDSLTVIDPKDGYASRVPLGLNPVELEGPHHAVADPSGRFVYVNLSMAVTGSGSGPHGSHGNGTLPGFTLKVDTADGRIVASTQVDPNPGDLTISPDGRTLYVTHYNLATWSNAIAAGDVRDADSNLIVIDADSMTIRQRVRICPAAHGVRITPNGSTLYASCGPDELAVVDLTDAFSVHRVVLPESQEQGACKHCPYSLAPAPDGTVWVATLGVGGGGALYVYDPKIGEFDDTRTIAVCGSAMFPAFRPGGTADHYEVFVPEQGTCGDFIRHFRVEAGAVTPVQVFPLPVSSCLKAHMIHLSDSAYLVCEGDHVSPGSVVRLGLDPLTVLSTLPAGVFPDGIIEIPMAR